MKVGHGKRNVHTRQLAGDTWKEGMKKEGRKEGRKGVEDGGAEGQG